MSNQTVARPTTEQSCHWYWPNGEACYEVKRADGKGMRPTTLADARKLGLLPSVTTILGVLSKPGLESWKTEQALLAALTTPRPPEESLDAFIHRVLHTERIQDQESDIAKKRGTEMHAGLEDLFDGGGCADELRPWIQPVYEFVRSKWEVLLVEEILVGNGYAGKCDLIAVEEQGWEWVIDFKTTKKIPKESYWEHKCQTAAYLRCRLNGVRHANIYISTVNQGEFAFCDNGDYGPPFDAFACLVRYWQIANGYRPQTT